MESKVEVDAPYLKALEAAAARLSQIEALDSPYPLRDILQILADAADHLLGDHSCDAHGYEGVGMARDHARRLIADVIASTSVGAWFDVEVTRREDLVTAVGAAMDRAYARGSKRVTIEVRTAEEPKDWIRVSRREWDRLRRVPGVVMRRLSPPIENDWGEARSGTIPAGFKFDKGRNG